MNARKASKYSIGQEILVTSKKGVPYPGKVDWISEVNGTVQVALVGGGYGYIHPDGTTEVAFGYRPEPITFAEAV